jgi:antirestriction protein ArdC
MKTDFATRTRKADQMPKNESKFDLYQAVTDGILAKLDEGVIPWRRPFAGYGQNKMPRNYNSNRPYRGINVFILAFAGYGSPYWLTFKGAQAAGGQVRKGERGTLVVFWKRILVDDRDNPGKKKAIPLLRYFNVFNVEQCDGVDPTRGAGEQPEEDATFDPIESAEGVLSRYFDRDDAPELRISGNVATYEILGDVVTVPEPARFDVREEFYSAAYHEAVHSTGAASRLARKGIVGKRSTEGYADEELTAEMGAAMLCAVAGIAPATVDNSAAYVDHWRKVISEDPKLVVTAGARAQKAADYVLGETFEDETNKQAGELAVA